MSSSIPSRLGPHEVIREIGRGGMGVVYLARDTRLDRDVAIKALPEEFADDEARLVRLEREAKALAALTHPNILSVFDVGREGGQAYVVMELLRGGTLRERYDGHAVEWHSAVEIACGIADGLAAAHGRGVIHRDIKPDNLYLTGDGIVKILDFGIAARDTPGTMATGGDLTKQTKKIRGTPEYMSPEQARGEKADGRTDIFAVGCVLHELLTGVSGFGRETIAETIAAVLHGEPRTPRETSSSIPPELMRIVRRCLEKDASHRFQSARDLSFTLKGFVGGVTTPTSQANQIHQREVPSIAVLPFANLSADPENEYFSSGITDEIISALATIKGLRVPGRTSSFAFREGNADVREIGRQLNVESVLEGSVRRAGDRVRVTTQLISVSDGYQMWSERFDRKLDDVFELQDEIAHAIVKRLRVSLTGEGESKIVKAATDDVQAYEEYLRGRYAYEQRGRHLLEAVTHMERAIELDPSFALAHAALAEAQSLAGFYGIVPPHEIMPKAKSAAQRALAIDPTVAEAHAALGHVHTLYEWDWGAAEAAYDRALSAKPTYSLALIGKGTYLYGLVLGRLEEGVSLGRSAVVHDPLNGALRSSLGTNLILAGQMEEAYAMLVEAAEAHPEAFMVYRTLGVAAGELGRLDEAADALSRSVSLSDRHAWPVTDLIRVFLQQGRIEAAQALHDELVERSRHEYVQKLMLSFLPAMLGNHDESLSWLEQGCDEREAALVALMRWPPCMQVFEEMKDEPRLGRIIERIGFPDAGHAGVAGR